MMAMILPATPVVTVEPKLWDVAVAGEKVGHVVCTTSSRGDRWSASLTTGPRSESLGYDFLTRDDAVAAILSEQAKPRPEPCSCCGQPVPTP